MQGVFNVDWKSKLDPAPDDEAQREARLRDSKPKPKEDARGGDLDVIPEESHGRKSRHKHGKTRGSDSDDSDGSDGSGTGSDEERNPHPTGPQAATPCFTLDKKKYYVIPGEHEPRPGRFGHYVRPYRFNQAKHMCEPVKKRAAMGRHPELTTGMPGIPWPPKNVCKLRYSQYKDWDEFKEAIEETDQDWYDDTHDLLDLFQTSYINSLPPRISVDDFADHWKEIKELSPAEDRDPYQPPDPDRMLENVDYVMCPKPTLKSEYYEIGRATLERQCEEGESLDLAFARRMQGLLGGTLVSVWDCLDPDFNPADRADVMSQFLDRYAAHFYDTLDYDDDALVTREVAQEALQQHKIFCQEWVHKHYKNLTPTITSAAESLVSSFYDSFILGFRDKITLEMMTRIFMRDASLSPLFASCLNFHMSTLDQTRPWRNPTYKQMTVTSTASAQQYYALLRSIDAKRVSIHKTFERLVEHEESRMFNPLVIDWYSIAGQLPQTHKHFRHRIDNLLFKRRRANQDVLPWKVARTKQN